MEGLLGFVLAGVALAGSPGPNTLSLAAASAAFGATRVVAYFTGILLGMVVVMAVVAMGLVGMLLAVPGAAPVVTFVAAAYFVWLAWRIATAPPLTEGSAERSPPGLLGGFGLSIVNPKGYVAMAALFSGFVLLPGRVIADAGLKIAVLTVVIFAVNVAWLLVGAAMTRLFRDPRTNRIVNVAFAILLLASVVLAVLV